MAAAIATVALVLYMNLVGAGGTDAGCDTEFNKIMQDDVSYPDLATKTKRWEALGARCSGTGSYESRLGTFYTRAGRYDAARQVIRRGLARKTAYEKELRLALSDIEFREGALDKSEEQSLALIRDFPDWAGGHVALGETRLVQGRIPEGIQSLERANSLSPSSGAYTLLAMAYYKTGRPRDSVVSMQKALKLDAAALRHTQAVCATVYSLLAIGEMTAADDLLTQHLQVQPTASGDPVFKRAAAAVKQRQAK